jgi:hypothetical protein
MRAANWFTLTCSNPFSPRVCAHSSGLDAHLLASARMTKVTDDRDNPRSDPPAAPWRVPVHIAVPVVLACALMGYGISLLLPLHPAPANPARAWLAPAAKTGALEISPANPAENPRIVHKAAVTDLPQHPQQIEPRGAESPKPPIAPAVETGSVDAAGEPKVIPGAAKAVEATRPEAQARRAMPRRPRRVYYWRPRPKPPAGPVEKFFSALVK